MNTKQPSQDAAQNTAQESQTTETPHAHEHEHKPDNDTGSTESIDSGAHDSVMAQFNNTANKLTALRIIFVPSIMICLLRDEPLAGFIAAVLFGIAGITDYFDGYYARTEKTVTVLGQLLDPLADKFLVVSSLVMLQHLGRIHPFIVIVLIVREMAITGLRAIASSEGIVIPASRIAKWKTVMQMAAIPMLMLHETYFYIPMQLLGTICIWISLLISVWSAKDYIKDFFIEMREKASQHRADRRARKLARKQKRRERIRRLLEKNPDIAEFFTEK